MLNSTVPRDTASLTSPAPPVVLTPHHDGIPAELRARQQWVTHRDKAPYAVATGELTDYTNKHNLASFDAAWLAAIEHGHDGVGFSTLPIDPYILIDVDHCVRPDGSIAPLVLFWAQCLGTYAEYSPGDGVHMIGRGRLPGEGNRFSMTDPTTGERFKVEVYDRDRYFRITGRTPEGLPAEIIENQDGVDAFCGFLAEQRGTSRRAGRQPTMPDGVTSPRMADEEVLLRARNDPKYVPDRFDGVFDRGDLSGQGGDHSASDFALCCRLAYWTQDVEQLDRLFRKSRLMRDKWDEVHYSDGTTYGARTIDNALADVSEHYSPPDRPETEGEDRATRPGACVYQTIDLATGERQVHRGGIVCRRGDGGELRTTRGAQWLP